LCTVFLIFFYTHVWHPNSLHTKIAAIRFRIRIHLDPHSISRLNPEPHSECGSGSRRSKESQNEGKSAAKRHIIRHKKYKKSV
jgi:hypothetical protein